MTKHEPFLPKRKNKIMSLKIYDMFSKISVPLGSCRPSIILFLNSNTSPNTESPIE